VAVAQRNIISLSYYYSRITLERLADLLALTVEEVEKNVADMAIRKFVYAKIDGLEGTVNFTNSIGWKKVFELWLENIDRSMDLMERACISIQKEAIGLQIS
jgi:26S proteasome regulatory subunit N5